MLPAQSAVIIDGGVYRHTSVETLGREEGMSRNQDGGRADGRGGRGIVGQAISISGFTQVAQFPAQFVGVLFAPDGISWPPIRNYFIPADASDPAHTRAGGVLRASIIGLLTVSLPKSVCLLLFASVRSSPFCLLPAWVDVFR